MSDKVADRKVYRVVIDAPIDVVWSELVKTDEVLPFFFGAVCDCPEMKQGSPLAMRTPSGRFTSVVGEILEFSPPHRYSHTFRFTNYDDPPCKVTYELEETAAGVQFSLVTENVPVGTRTEKSMDQGGTFIVNNFKALVETGKPTFGGRMILGMIRLMEPFSPKAARSERWPLGGAGAARSA